MSRLSLLLALLFSGCLGSGSDFEIVWTGGEPSAHPACRDADREVEAIVETDVIQAAGTEIHIQREPGVEQAVAIKDAEWIAAINKGVAAKLSPPKVLIFLLCREAPIAATWAAADRTDGTTAMKVPVTVVAADAAGVVLRSLPAAHGTIVAHEYGHALFMEAMARARLDAEAIEYYETAHQELFADATAVLALNDGSAVANLYDLSAFPLTHPMGARMKTLDFTIPHGVETVNKADQYTYYPLVRTAFWRAHMSYQRISQDKRAELLQALAASQIADMKEAFRVAPTMNYEQRDAAATNTSLLTLLGQQAVFTGAPQ